MARKDRHATSIRPGLSEHRSGRSATAIQEGDPTERSRSIRKRTATRHESYVHSQTRRRLLFALCAYGTWLIPPTVLLAEYLVLTSGFSVGLKQLFLAILGLLCAGALPLIGLIGATGTKDRHDSSIFAPAVLVLVHLIWIVECCTFCAFMFTEPIHFG